jgi:hypothetical protein
MPERRHRQQEEKQVQTSQQDHRQRSALLIFVLDILEIVSGHLISSFFFRMSLMATHTKTTTRINPMNIQSAVLKPNIFNSS